jgi:hypothetical protein
MIHIEVSFKASKVVHNFIVIKYVSATEMFKIISICLMVSWRNFAISISK